MRIVGIKVLEFQRRLDGRSWNPTFRWHERRAPLLVIETDTGLAGVGEAWSRQSQVSLVLDFLADHWAPALLGRDPLARESLDTGLDEGAATSRPWVVAAAASAVDIALWDLAAQVARQPLWQALGGNSGQVAVYASGGLYRDDATSKDVAREFEAYASLGFVTMKMKIGAMPLEADLERVRSARSAIGDDRVLWVDAVNQLTRKTAAGWCGSLVRAGVVAIQAPLPFGDVEGMASINASMLPVIASEAEYREEVFRTLLDAESVTYLQYCLGLCGGFTAAMRIDDEAATHRIKSTPQCFSTAILQAASLHFGAARRNVVAVEFHRFHDHLSAALPAAMKRVDSGFVHLDDTPGLGVAPPTPGAQLGGGDVRMHRNISFRTEEINRD